MNYCHLSNVEIAIDENVFVLPMKYGSVQNSSELTYLTTSNCEPIFNMIKGQYNGYGSIDKESEETDSGMRFVNLINQKFENAFQSKRNSGFLVLKEPESNSETRYIISDDKTLYKMIKSKKIPKKKPFYSSGQLLEVISNEELLYNTGRSLFHVGFIIIKKSFIDRLLSGLYKETFHIINEKFREVIEKYKPLRKEYDNLISMGDKDSDELYDLYEKLSLFRTEIEETLNFFNSCRSLSRELETAFTKSFKDDADYEELIKMTVTTAVIMSVYEDQGKSLYPNTHRRGSEKLMMQFNEEISTMIKEREID